MSAQTLYLLAGNGGAADWWRDALPHFRRYLPLPLELPGFGDNPEPPCADLDEYAQALLAMTEPGSAIYAVGVNALIVLHAMQRRPGHFARVVLQAPIGAYLWQRSLPALMRPMPARKLVHWVLAHRPQWVGDKYSNGAPDPERLARIAAGYRRCRAFIPYWDMVRADNALALLEWVRDPVEIVWGVQDKVIDHRQLPAWAAILARADLRVSLMPDWGHYPWMDAPQEFAAWLEGDSPSFVAHSKGGRLRLAALAGLPVPAAVSVHDPDDSALERLLAENPLGVWAVRSSGSNEDQADCANAGLNQTWLRVRTPHVRAQARELLADGMDEVVVQRFVEPSVSGIAFVRKLGIEVEWVRGHLAALADGRVTPQRAILSRMGGDWSEGDFTTVEGLTRAMLERFLHRVLHTFHYVHGDVEWAWDGTQLWLLQYRPISDYGWRRHLTAANIAEILPPSPSRLIDYALARAAHSIPAIMARWDSRVLEDAEPFTARSGGALYINNDYALARLADWGIPFGRYGGQVGGATPQSEWHWWRLPQSLPRLWRMQREARAALHALEPALRRFDAELAALADSGANGQTLADWLVRFQMFAVQGNLCIATALASNFGDWLGQPATVYRDLTTATHRLPWETDPATPREAGPPLPLQAFPAWPAHIRLAHRFGQPGLRGWYLQVREWYRDNLMRIFFRLHQAMPAADREYWFAPVTAARTHNNAFWQDGHAGAGVESGFVIYPGTCRGVLGRDILVEDSLDPGRYAHYRAAGAVIARLGGRLSHGATLLRELGKPSAVMPALDMAWLGREVEYRDGGLRLLEAT